MYQITIDEPLHVSQNNTALSSLINNGVRQLLKFYRLVQAAVGSRGGTAPYFCIEVEVGGQVVVVTVCWSIVVHGTSHVVIVVYVVYVLILTGFDMHTEIVLMLAVDRSTADELDVERLMEGVGDVEEVCVGRIGDEDMAEEVEVVDIGRTADESEVRGVVGTIEEGVEEVGAEMGADEIEVEKGGDEVPAIGAVDTVTGAVYETGGILDEVVEKIGLGTEDSLIEAMDEVVEKIGLGLVESRVEGSDGVNASVETTGLDDGMEPGEV